MFYYRFKDKLLFSKNEYAKLEGSSLENLIKSDGIIYFLISSDPLKSRRSYSLSDPSLLTLTREGINLFLREDEDIQNLPQGLVEKIKNGCVKVVNTSYPSWMEALNTDAKGKWNINVIGLGDVGGTLVTGLRLLGGDCISSIGIFDLDPMKAKRWEYEAGQIMDNNKTESYPEVRCISEDELFNCDMFVFCVSIGVPSIGDEARDVRMVQFEGNSKIINGYAREARERGFEGIFAVVSDPVDLLCKSVFLSSNKNSSGAMDFLGLAPEQIRGYGLGVMNARAVYYAKENNWNQYFKYGRVFGPHGEGLIAADNINDYNDEISLKLTELVKNANIEVRKTGFKPYIAPAFSSGALSLINTIRGEWHYSATFIGGVYMGAKNRLINTGIELERSNLDEKLIERLKETYNRLDMII